MGHTDGSQFWNTSTSPGKARARLAARGNCNVAHCGCRHHRRSDLLALVLLLVVASPAGPTSALIVSAKPIPLLQNSNERAKKPPAWTEVWDGIGQQKGRPFGRLIGRAGEPAGGP